MRVKTHLIVTDQYEEYSVKWHRRLLDSNPKLINGVPLFILIRHSGGRMELNTIDINYLERCAKKLTSPKGRGAISVDKAYVYIKEVGGNEKLLGILTHKRVKTFAPMYDKVGYK